MPRKKSKADSVNQVIETLIRDRDRREVLRIGMREYTVIEPDGSMTTRKVSEYITTMDGIAWSPLMLLKDPPLTIAICHVCRNPRPSWFRRVRPSHGLVTTPNTVYCVDCANVVCGLHRQLGSDGCWRCPPCAKRFKRRTRIQRVLFALAEDE
jgi:hypothetical protein